jgi:predicted alpha/beta superfamily hydrolase
MKRMLAFYVLVTVVQLKVSAQFPQVTIPGSEVRKLTSTIVKDQEYELQILLPSGYANKTKKYSVVYVMDSQWDLPLVKCIYGEHYYDGFIPELIVVGVTWGGVSPNPDSLRARDYTPTNIKGIPQSGGADKFLSFMKEELFPFIESNYRADPDNRSLIGCSLGGLFTIYTMFTHTNMFTGYAAASPAVDWDNEVLYKYEKDFAEKKLNRPVRLYMTVGDVERGRPFFEKMATFMTGKHYQNVSIHPKVLENTGHSGTKGETYARGLQYIFERPKLKLTNTILNKYAGTYKSQDGNITVDIKVEDNQLAVYTGPNNKYLLYASGEADFYSTSEFLNIHFKISNNTVEGFQVDRYGGNFFLTRAK